MNEFPLHWSVYENDLESLKSLLKRTPKTELEIKDARGKTPLELAIFLNHYECAKLLVEHGADCCHVTKAGWNLVQESVSSANPDLIRLVMTYREYQRMYGRTNGIPELLNKLKQAPDFYVEMKWEFTSWIPLVSKACPSDVYKIYKSGSNVRIDTTLVGFNGTSWERGNRSYLFNAVGTDGSATIVEIDHLKRTYHVDKISTLDDDEPVNNYEPEEEVVQNKLTSPNIVTFLDIEKIEFERNRSGLWGWRTEKTDKINGYECKVYTANNLQLITKTRIEHLNGERAREFMQDMEESEQRAAAAAGNPNLPGFLGNLFQGSVQHIKVEKQTRKLPPAEYFHKHANIDYFMNGYAKAIDETRRTQTFNATLSLCDSFPLSLHEQVLPIVDLMAVNNSHFKKLKEFITLQLPSGFPIKIEIPIYRVITAKVTFGNIHALDTPVEHVTTIRKNNTLNVENNVESSKSLKNNNRSRSSDDSEISLLSDETSNEAGASASLSRVDESQQAMSVVNENAFKVPSSYRCTNYYMPSGADLSFLDTTSGGQQAVAANAQRFQRRVNHYGQQAVDEDDILLQLAIQQSLMQHQMEAGGGQNTNTDTPAEFNIAPLSDQSSRDGRTHSLEEYNARRGFYEGDDELVLQRVLAESLLATGAEAIAITPAAAAAATTTSAFNQPSVDNEEYTLREILELSKREEDERKRREEEEDEQLRKILELSLLEK